VPSAVCSGPAISPPVRVWFARNVAGTYQLIDHLRDNVDGLQLHVIGTYPRPDHLMLQACDEAAVEPLLPAADYVEWALEFAAEHRVDVFVPGEARQLAVSQALDRFEAQGTRVQVSGPEAILALQDKAETYRQAAGIGIAVPVHAVVRTGTELRAAYDRMRAAGHGVTVKPVTGFGGSGFWKLSDEKATLEDFLGLPSGRMRIDDAVAILDRTEEVIPRLLVSQYLSSPEDSVDVLASQGEVLASVIRRKPSKGETRSFPVDPELTALTARLVRHVGPEYLCNVQWRRVDGRPVLLEVNTRAASGLAQSCASGVNFPYLALRLCLGLPVQVPEVARQADQVSYTHAAIMRPLTPPGRSDH
jgi:glutathione synthase/RimK-type ligase-like ATP-grasp enzyme